MCCDLQLSQMVSGGLGGVGKQRLSLKQRKPHIPIPSMYSYLQRPQQIVDCYP